MPNRKWTVKVIMVLFLLVCADMVRASPDGRTLCLAVFLMGSGTGVCQTACLPDHPETAGLCNSIFQHRQVVWCRLAQLLQGVLLWVPSVELSLVLKISG